MNFGYVKQIWKSLIIEFWIIEKIPFIKTKNEFLL